MSSRRKSADLFFQLGLPLGVGIALVCTALWSTWPVNHDSASYLQIGQLLLGGALPYVDYVELNPPLIQYLHTAPVLLSSLVGLSLPLSFSLLVSGLCLYSAVALHSQLSRATDLDGAQCALVTTGWLCLALAVLCNNSFGQREHLFVLAYAPWLFVRFARHRDVSSPTWQTLSIGALAASFALLKPHLLLLLVISECWLLFRSRSWRTLLAPEALAFATLGLLYALHFLWVPDAMREAFFGRWLPMIAANYDSYDTDTLEILRSDIGIAVLIATLTALACTPWLRRSHGLGALIETLCLATVVGAAMFFLQHKGWYYHAYPCLGACGLLLLVGIASRSSAAAQGRDGTRIALLAVVLVAGFFVYFAFDRAPRVQAGARAMAVLIARDTDPDDKVAFIDTSVAPSGTAMFYAERLPGHRFMPAFPIAFFSQQRARATQDARPFDYPSARELSGEERQVLGEIASDLKRNVPPLLFVRSDDCLACPPGFSINEYLQQSGWTTRNLGDYELLGNAAGYARYGRRDRVAR